MTDYTLIPHYFPGLEPEQLERFRQLDGLYREWNGRINVISRKDIDALYLHHVLHSLAIGVFRPFRPGETVLDVGTGGGFPGIPLAILFPQTQFTLCDSIAKKIRVVEAVSQALGLDNVRAVRSRAEELEGGWDFVVSRAVTELKQFLPFVRGRYRQGILYLKGGDTEAEISDCVRSLRMKREQFECRAVTDWFPEPFFAEKKIVFIRN